MQMCGLRNLAANIKKPGGLLSAAAVVSFRATTL